MLSVIRLLCGFFAPLSQNLTAQMSLPDPTEQVYYREWLHQSSEEGQGMRIFTHGFGFQLADLPYRSTNMRFPGSTYTDPLRQPLIGTAFHSHTRVQRIDSHPRATLHATCLRLFDTQVLSYQTTGGYAVILA